jgi:hypothetical protein
MARDLIVIKGDFLGCTQACLDCADDMEDASERRHTEDGQQAQEGQTAERNRE